MDEGPGPRKALLDYNELAPKERDIMAMVKDVPRTNRAKGMSLAEIREQLLKFQREGRIGPSEKARLEKKMKQIMGRLNKLGAKGGGFAQVQLSEEMKRLCRH